MAGRQFASVCRKVVCVGRNYAEHAKELGNAVPTSPMLFLKPASSFIASGEPIVVPKACQDLHHEVELGIVIGKAGRKIDPANALDHVAGYALALDMTARDLQEAAKSKGHPWSVAKGYDTFCPISDFIPAADIPDPANVGLWCKVDGRVTQDGNTKDMVFNVPHLISFISGIFKLEPNDVILTGTPSGVGPVLPGQTIEAGIHSLGSVSLSCPVVAENE